MQAKLPKRLLFIHDQIPADGVSGMVVFLRHFQRLQHTEVHIAVPEHISAKGAQQELPKNFICHGFALRQWFWPPFREPVWFLRYLRKQLLTLQFRLLIRQTGAEHVVTVLFHYYAEAAVLAAQKEGIPSMVFLHDRWDLKTQDKRLQQLRIQIGNEVLHKASTVCTVTHNLASCYGKAVANKAVELYPIPNGQHWIIPQPNRKKQIMYAGTVEAHHIRFFMYLLSLIQDTDHTLCVISYQEVPIQDPKLQVLPSFKKNIDVLSYLHANAYVLLVNYGTDLNDNPFADTSFPSKFIEYSYLNLPMLCIAPATSPFYTLLQKENYPLAVSGTELMVIPALLQQLLNDTFWKQAQSNVVHLRNQYFDADKLQATFEVLLSNQKY